MQLDFLNILRKLTAEQNLQVTLVRPPFDGLEHCDYGLRKALDPAFDWQALGQLIVAIVKENTLFLGEDVFNLHFASFRLPDEPDTVCLIGPWTHGERTAAQSRAVEQMLGPEAAAAVQEYYNGVRILRPEWLSEVFVPLVSSIFPDSDFCIREDLEFLPLNFEPDIRYFNEPTFTQEIPAAMLERRYAAEEQMLTAISKGDHEGALRSKNALTCFQIKGRFTDTPYQIRTKMTILNTLLRKAIQSSMIHPFYIDQISSRYARLIENMDVRDDDRLTVQMLREYCAYVQRYSLRAYSPLVQKVINHINLNLGDDLSIGRLADLCFISPGYLSTLFKRETGVTLVSYINSQRIDRAAHLLTSTQLSIAAIAEQVGITDVNYFTKLFKKAMHITPSRFRCNRARQK